MTASLEMMKTIAWKDGDGDDYITDANPTYGGGNDTLNGGNGNDTLLGGIGNDQLDGGYGEDSVVGGAGDDVLWGSHGDDNISGGSGDDYLHGGQGADVFEFSGESGSDTILDFGVGVDMIQIASSSTGISDFNDLLSVSRTHEADHSDIVVDLGVDSQVVIRNVDLQDLSADNFLFV